MGVHINKTFLDYPDPQGIQQLGAIAVLPETLNKSTASALFTHGFTSHKGTLLNWALRLAEEGLPSLFFDLPGHYLGTFSEVSDFTNFTHEGPKLFIQAYESLKKLCQNHGAKNFSPMPIIGGHSLGALLALKSSKLDYWGQKKPLIVAVGFGLPPQGETHIFSTPFYKSTLQVRSQLVSPALDPDVVFPWIKEEKEKLILSGQRIYFLTGQDDLVVGNEGSERLAEQLREQGNEVFVEKPTKLPHHQPELAAPHIKKFLKDQGYFSTKN